MTTSRFPLAGALALVLALLASSCGSGVTAPAATVNDTRISEDDVTDELSAIRGNDDYLESVQGQGLRVLGTADGTFDSAFVAQLLTLQVYYQLVEEELERRDIEVTDDDIESVRPQVEQSVGGEEVFAEFTEGYQRRQLERLAQVVTLDEALREAFAGDEGERFYRGNRELFESRCISHILVETEEEAEQVLADLEAGAAFADLARERSTDVGSGQQGGELGCRPAAEANFVEPFREVAMELEEGDTSDVVETEFGFHVIRVTEIELPPFDEVADQLSEQALNVWLIDATGKADVEVNPRYGRWEIGGPETGGRGMVVPPEGPQQPGGGDSLPGLDPDAAG